MNDFLRILITEQRVPKLKHVGYKRFETYYDGPLGKRTIVNYQPVFVVE